MPGESRSLRCSTDGNMPNENPEMHTGPIKFRWRPMLRKWIEKTEKYNLFYL